MRPTRVYARVFWVLTASLVAVSIGVAATGTELSRGKAAPPPLGGTRSPRPAR